MFIAHVPAAYVLSKKLQGHFDFQKYLWIGIVGGVISDLDLFYFYLIDGRQTLHHSYWIHRPVYWLVIAVAIFLLICLQKDKRYFVMAGLFFSNVFLHLILDTFVGRIDWLYPWSERSFYLFEVEAVYDFWVFNFIFHWTFIFEMMFIVWAIVISVKGRHDADIQIS